MEYKELYPLDISPSGDSVKGSIEKNRNEILNLGKQMGLSATGGGSGLRNRVLSGKFSNGSYTYLTGNGLSVVLDGTTTPLCVTFANGYADQGAVDYLTKIDTKVSAWSVPSNNTSYLYIARSTSGGISYDSTTIKPLTQTIPPEGVVGAHYYNTLDQKMYMYNGTAWAATQRVFVASVVTNGTDVSTINYFNMRNGSVTTEDIDVSITTDSQPTSNTGVLTDIVNGLATQIKNIVGKTNWFDKSSKSIEEIATFMSTFTDKTYPVGSIYMSVVNTNPGTMFGGTWEQLEQGRMLLAQGVNYAAGSVGGSATHTLSINEMPSHNHGGATASNGNHNHTGTTDAQGNHTHAVGGQRSYGKYTGNFGEGDKDGFSKETSANGNHTHWFATTTTGNHNHGINLQGGGVAHNNMPPYLSVYMWKRTA